VAALALKLALGLFLRATPGKTEKVLLHSGRRRTTFSGQSHVSDSGLNIRKPQERRSGGRSASTHWSKLWQSAYAAAICGNGDEQSVTATAGTGKTSRNYYTPGAAEKPRYVIKFTQIYVFSASHVES
jgi:hypothetical protein